MRSFWDGFEKRASSLVGAMPGVTSGLRNYAKAGKLRTASPVSGQVIGPRITPGPTPAPKPIPASMSSQPNIPHQPTNVKIPKPKQSSRGVPSTTL
jgi:hypothetical protein